MTPQTVIVLSCIVVAICIVLSFIAGKKKKVRNIKLPVTETVFPVSADINEPVFYDVIKGTCENKEIKLTNIKWISENYENKVGEYVFKPISPKGYKLEDISIKVKVVVTECIKENEDNIEIINAAICDNGPKSFSVYDLTGCNLIKEMPRLTKYVELNDTIRHLGGYIQECRVTSDVVISTGTFGYLVVDNGASLVLNGKADVFTMIVESANKIDITSHYGNIGDIIQEQTTTVEYVVRNANQLSRYSLPTENVKILIGKNEYKGVIVDILSDIDYVTVEKGTTIDKITLSDTLKVLIGSGERELPVKWKCDNYSSEEKVFEFIPEFEGYVISDCVDKLVHRVISATSGAVKTVILGLPEKTILTEKTDSVKLCVNAACTLGDDSFTVKLSDVKFVFDEAKSAYILDKSSVDSVFDIDDVEIFAEFANKEVYKDDKIEIDSIKVCVNADKFGKMSITDIAGIQTFATDISEIKAIKVSGNNSELIIDSAYANIVGDIDIGNISGTATINVFPRYVSKLRYSADIADNIVICGVPASEYLNRTPLQMKKTFFANGIPVIIRQDDDGETYVYRANDLTKISAPVTCGTVFGGAYKAGVESTNVTHESGVLFDFYGGSEKGNIYGECYSCVSGGLVDNDWFGGCSSSEYCEKIIGVFEKGAIKRVWYGGGANSSAGVPGKVYSNDESAIELYFFDGIFTDFMYGAKSACGRDIFGNIRMEMFGGVGLNHYCGSTKDVVRGNVYATIYGGMVEKQFAQNKTVEGYTKIKAYRNVRVCGNPENKFPFTTTVDNDTFFYSFFDNEYEHKYRAYTRDISVPYSKDGDEGKLVVRFPEIKRDGQTKENRITADYSGDGMFVTFPNGQVMLIDTPLDYSWESYNRDVTALGIDHIDYFLLTHYHDDHYGCIPKLLETHTVGTFLLPNVNYSSPLVEGSIPEGSNVVRINMYDTMTVGEGDEAVKITFLNPPFFAKKVMVADNHNPFGLCAVFEFGTSKLMLDADTYDVNEAAWLYECPELISGVDVIKPGHHGITTSSRYDFFRVVDPKYICITNLREYGCHQNNTIYMLENINQIPADHIFSTGRHGMIKATLNGKKGEATVVTEYVEK